MYFTRVKVFFKYEDYGKNNKLYILSTPRLYLLLEKSI